MDEAVRRKAHDALFDVNYWTSDTILSHPDFAQARADYVDRVLALYCGDPFLNKLLMEGVRMVIFAVAICMEAGYREDQRDTWPTIGNLKRALSVFGLASPRRIEQVVGRLVQTRFLESRMSCVDRRVRLLIPTAKMIEHDRDWLIAHYAPLATLFGAEDYASVLDGDRRFQLAQRRVATGFFVQSAMVLQRNPDIMLFLSRDAGIFVLLELVKRSQEQGTPVVDLSLSDLGRRFSISRTHVRQLIQAAADGGLIELNQVERRITLMPRVMQSLDRFIADGMSNHDLTGAAARRELSLVANHPAP